jgi:energy-coupling factor transporter ATP-binding protein EcfA2
MSNKQHSEQINWLNVNVERLQRRLDMIKQKASKLSNWRLWTFIVAAVVTTLVFQTLGTVATLLSLVIALLAFFYLVKVHSRVDRTIHLFEFYIALRTDQIAHLAMDWEQIRNTQSREAIKDHPFENDLVITGPRSLHQFLNTTLSYKGEKALANHLLRTNPDYQQVPKIQQIIQALKRVGYFRERLSWVSYEAMKFNSSNLLDPDSLLNWINQRNKFQLDLSKKLTLSISLALINLLLLSLNIAGIFAAWWLVGLIIQYLLHTFFSRDIAHLMADAEKVNENLVAFGSILQFIEKVPLRNAETLESFLSPIRSEENKPTQFLKEVQILAGRAALTQGNALVGFLVNLVFPWDLYHSHRLNKLSEQLSIVLPKWIDCFTELEIYLSLANFAALFPDYHFPTFSETSNSPLIAEDLGHPLLTAASKVTNNFKIFSERETVLLTGSNMSGKSTFLRTIGVNIVLAYAGAPVNSKRFELKPMRLFTCINVSDSLADGFSYFYAEVRRLRQLLEATKNDLETPVLYLIDEIFRGTNNRERLIGSRSYVKGLSKSPGFGLVSTHDLELVKLQEEIKELKNYHFRETIEDGKMKFEYRIHEGPSPTTNALKIMEMEGLPVEQFIRETD